MIKTNQPLLHHHEKVTRKIADFWDQLSEGWHTLWGPHIHHGYYETNSSLSPRDAQEKLIEKLINLLDVVPQAHILDVGCGMGGSSLYLAKNYDAIVTGITLSPKQVEMARNNAQKNNIHQVTFQVEDALRLNSFSDNSFDIVWSLESCEQFFDKNKFIHEAYRVLKPGGQLMLATWCSNREEYEGTLEKKYKKLCLAFDLPYMPTIECYRALLTAQKFTVKFALDWSLFVKQSWDLGLSLLNAFSFLQLIKMGGWNGFRFTKKIKLMRDAFHQNQVQYGVFIATKN